MEGSKIGDPVECRSGLDGGRIGLTGLVEDMALDMAGDTVGEGAEEVLAIVVCERSGRV